MQNSSALQTNQPLTLVPKDISRAGGRHLRIVSAVSAEVLTAAERSIMSELASHRDFRRDMLEAKRITQATLGRMLGRHEDTVGKHLRKLVAKGYLTSVRTKVRGHDGNMRWGPNIYAITQAFFDLAATLPPKSPMISRSGESPDMYPSLSIPVTNTPALPPSLDLNTAPTCVDPPPPLWQPVWDPDEHPAAPATCAPLPAPAERGGSVQEIEQVIRHAEAALGVAMAAVEADDVISALLRERQAGHSHAWQLDRIDRLAAHPMAAAEGTASVKRMLHTTAALKAWAPWDGAVAADVHARLSRGENPLAAVVRGIIESGLERGLTINPSLAERYVRQLIDRNADRRTA